MVWWSRTGKKERRHRERGGILRFAHGGYIYIYISLARINVTVAARNDIRSLLFRRLWESFTRFGTILTAQTQRQAEKHEERDDGSERGREHPLLLSRERRPVTFYRIFILARTTSFSSGLTIRQIARNNGAPAGDSFPNATE